MADNSCSGNPIVWLLLMFVATQSTGVSAACQDGKSARSAHVVTIIDESSGMREEHSSLQRLLQAVETELRSREIGSTDGYANLYSVIGFGRHYPSPSLCKSDSCYAHVYTVRGKAAFGLGDVANAAAQLSTVGSTIEDGYQAILEAFDSLPAMDGPGVGTVALFLTDEDRDVHDPAPGLPLSMSNVVTYLQCEKIPLHMVVDVALSLDSNEDTWVLGLTYSSNHSLVLPATQAPFYTLQQTGGYQVYSYANTQRDYLAVSQALNGSYWDVNVLRYASNGDRRGFFGAFSAIAADSVALTSGHRATLTCASLAEQHSSCACQVYGGVLSSGQCSVELACQVTEWGDWSQCSVTCGEGRRSRQKELIQPRRLLGPLCGPRKQSVACSMPSCDGFQTTMTPTTTGGTETTFPSVVVQPFTTSPEPTQPGPDQLVVKIPLGEEDLPQMTAYEVMVYASNGSLMMRQKLAASEGGKRFRLASSDRFSQGQYSVLVAGNTEENGTYSLAAYDRFVPLLNTCPNELEVGRKHYAMSTAADPIAVDLVFVVDESSGMINEHKWLKDNIEAIEQQLKGVEIGSASSQPNLYAVVAFGGTLQPRVLSAVDDNSVLVESSRATELFAQLASRPQMDSEDGYWALERAMTGIPLRMSETTRSVFVLITDEDRDVGNAWLTLNNVTERLKASNVELVVVADIVFSKSRRHDFDVMGIDTDNGYFYLPNVTHGTASRDSFEPLSGYGNTLQDYGTLANRMNASLWTVGMMRFGAQRANAARAAIVQSLANRLRKTRVRCVECICERPHRRDSLGHVAVSKCLVDKDFNRCQCEASSSKYLPSTKQCMTDQDCVVSGWGEWSACSVTCNSGTVTRKRRILQQAAGHGARCPVLSEQTGCIREKCDIDCVVGRWKAWSSCDVTCGGGQQSRWRDILVPQKGVGKACPRLIKTSECNTHVCPVDCVVSPWRTWSQCSKTCDRGQQTRYRAINVASAGTGSLCPTLVDVRACQDEPCDLDCLVSPWSEWSLCSHTCDSGIQVRKRNVTRDQRFDGEACPDLDELQACFLKECDVNCQVSDWTPWSDCSVTCGQGMQNRLRTVTVYPRANGTPCPSRKIEQSCEPRQCNRDCVVDEWSDWSTCSKSCDDGVQTRSRNMLVAPVESGQPCPDLDGERRCNLRPCDIDCRVGEWSPWTQCSVTCDEGTRTHSRTVRVKPEGNGLACPLLTAEQRCENRLCDVDCQVGAWTEWSHCSATCGPGVRRKLRSITVIPVASGRSCPRTEEEQACHLRECDVDCVVGPWKQWSQCTTTCGPGSRTRSRDILVQPVAFGKLCPLLSLVDLCQERVCDVDCTVDSWAPWSQCSVSCNLGRKSRQRSVLVPPVAGGSLCPSLNDNQLCAPRLCVACENRYTNGTVVKRLQPEANDRAAAAEVVFVLDESDSMMSGVQFVKSTVVQDLDAKLSSAGIGTDARAPNRYALVGFGRNRDGDLFKPHHYRSITTGSDFLTSSEFQSVATGSATTGPGSLEDGYLALEYVFDKLPLRRNPAVAIQVVLITNDDRDVTPDGQNLTHASIRRMFRHNEAFLNVIVDNQFLVRSSPALGGDNVKVFVLGAPGHVRRLRGPIKVGAGFGSTGPDYVQPALREGGSVWDINSLQSVDVDSMRVALLETLAEQAASHWRQCERCVCEDDGGRGQMNCQRQRHQAECKCEMRNGQFDHFKHICTTS